MNPFSAEHKQAIAALKEELNSIYQDAFGHLKITAEVKEQSEEFAAVCGGPYNEYKVDIAAIKATLDVIKANPDVLLKDQIVIGGVMHAHLHGAEYKSNLTQYIINLEKATELDAGVTATSVFIGYHASKFVTTLQVAA